MFPQQDELIEPSVYAKLFAIQSEMPTIPKSATNPHFKSKYADLPTIMEILQPLLTKHKVLMLQPVYSSNDENVINICTRFIDIESGRGVSAVTTMPIGNNKTPQAFGSAITYARRYALCSFLGIVADEDDDGNTSSLPGKLSDAQIKRLYTIGTKQGYTQKDIMSKLAPKGIRKIEEMPLGLYESFVNWLEANPKKEE